MKYARKNLWLLAVAGLLSVAMVSGCGNDGTSSLSSSSSSEKIPPVKKLKFAEVVSADKDFTDFVVNGAGQAYLTAENGKKLLTAKNNFGDGASWKIVEMALEAAAFDNKTAGKASLSDTITGLVPTAKGVLVERGGVGYFDGAAYTAAWSNATTGILGGTGTHVKIDGNIGSGDKGTLSLYAGVVSNGADEYPVLFKNGTGWGVTHETAVNFTPAKLDSWVGPKVTGRPFIVQSGDNALVVHSDGVYMIAKDNMGKEVKKNQVLVLSALGNVSAAKFVAGKLYVSAAVAGDENGLFVYNLTTEADAADATKTVTKLEDVGGSDDWNATAVVDIAVKGNNVYAVTADKLILVAADGKKGAPVDAAGTMPKGMIKAQFVGNGVVAVTPANIYFGTER